MIDIQPLLISPTRHEYYIDNFDIVTHNSVQGYCLNVKHEPNLVAFCLSTNIFAN